MAVGRLSRRARIAKQIGRDPAEIIHEMVYVQDRHLRVAATRFGVSLSTAWRWLDKYEREQAATSVPHPSRRREDVQPEPVAAVG